jgi:hypothetical protein
VQRGVEKLVFVASKVELKLVVDHRTPFRSRHERRMSIGCVCMAWRLGKEEEKKMMLMNDRNQAKSLRIPD